MSYQPQISSAHTAVAAPIAVDDLVPHEPVLELVEVSDNGSFPKVLRRRLDQYFATRDLSPKGDLTMWTKIGVGLGVLTASWMAIYALHPGAWHFLGLYVLGGLAQTFLLLNIAHDSNHNAISS